MCLRFHLSAALIPAYGRGWISWIAQHPACNIAPPAIWLADTHGGNAAGAPPIRRVAAAINETILAQRSQRIESSQFESSESLSDGLQAYHMIEPSPTLWFNYSRRSAAAGWTSNQPAQDRP